MKFRGYPVTKDSGVPWIGEVPGHWTISKVKWLFNVVNGATPASNEEAYWDGGIPFATPDDLGKLEGDTLANTSRSISEQGYHSCGTNLVPRGSLLISTRAPIGHIAIAGTAVCTNQGIRSLVKKQPLNSKYFYYLLRAAVPELQSRGQGTTFQELPATQLKAVDLCVPPESEQGTIADFLDGQSQDIQILISKINLLKNLLQEYRQALITQAVTKGLDPNVPMKDSGIEWLGEIPEHWDVRRLKWMCDINPSKREIGYVDGKTLVSFLPMELIGDDGSVQLVDTRVIEEVQNGYTYFRDDDVLVAKITPCFENGKGALVQGLVNGIGFGTTELHVLRPRDNVYPRFLWYITASYDFRHTGTAMMEGAAGQKRVPEQFVRDFPVALPPKDEQKKIARFLDGSLESLNAILANSQQMIVLLHEYRQSLITATVTGKIDVRQDQREGVNVQDVC